MVFSSSVITDLVSTTTAGTTTTGAPGTNASVSNSGTEKDRILNFVIPRGNTGLQGEQGIQGIQGVQGPAGISSNVFVYTFATNGGTPPASGHILLNNSNPNLATSMYVSHIDKKGYDNDVLYANINPNSKLILQRSNDSNTFIEYNVTSKVINTGYIEFIVEYQEKGGTIGNNDEILLIVQLSGLQGPQGEQGLSSSVFDYKLDRLNFNTTGMTSGTIRFNNADLTLSTEMYVHYLNEFGKDFQRMISLFPTHSRIIIQDKATANYILYDIPDLIVRTANQFITIPIQVVQNINQASLTNNLSVYLINQSGTIGLTGEQGPAGSAATVTVGTVTALAPGSTPTVTNSGTTSNAILNFGLVTGNTGASGGGGGNCTVTNFYYHISNSVDTTFYTDDKMSFSWDETNNYLRANLITQPAGSTDCRSLAQMFGSTYTTARNTAIVAIGTSYQISDSINASLRCEVFISPDNDPTYPAYHITAYNLGESFNNVIWLKKIHPN